MPKAINPFSKRKSSSPFSNAQRKKPGVQKSGLAGKTDDEERLEDIGRISALAHVNVDQDVVSLLRHVRSHTFEEIPTRGAGMNSTQISGTFRFRAALPPIVSIAHLHALSRSTTETERELAQVIAAGKIRKVAIPGRGKGGSAVGDGVVLVEDWKQSLYQETALEDQIKEKYVALMDAHPGSATAPMSGLTDVEIQSLVSTGFLTNPAALTSGLGNLFAKTSTAADGTIAKSGYSGATGTLAAIGGHDAIHASGGSGSTLATKDNRGPGIKLGEQMTFSLPSTGSYLKFLIEARLHFLYLLRQLSPRYKEATKEMLEEKWNGNVPNDPISKQKRMRGEWSGVLPGKTKRWRDFYGLEFDWVLAECVGSGLVELFDTGSVGTAVRAI